MWGKKVDPKHVSLSKLNIYHQEFVKIMTEVLCLLKLIKAYVYLKLYWNN